MLTRDVRSLVGYAVGKRKLVAFSVSSARRRAEVLHRIKADCPDSIVVNAGGRTCKSFIQALARALGLPQTGTIAHLKGWIAVALDADCPLILIGEADRLPTLGLECLIELLSGGRAPVVLAIEPGAFAKARRRSAYARELVERLCSRISLYLALNGDGEGRWDSGVSDAQWTRHGGGLRVVPGGDRGGETQTSDQSSAALQRPRLRVLTPLKGRSPKAG